MRIIAGRWQSRRLIRPRTEATRPMPDRVKEAVFNILGARYGCPGGLPALHVADVFAGSGSLGLEALSRGAAQCCFFERDPNAVEALKRNLNALRVGAETTIVTRDAWHHATEGVDGRPFELVFLDPPYSESQDASPTGSVRRYLARVSARDDNRPLVVLHHSATVAFVTDAADPWRVEDQRTIGSNAVSFFSR